MADYASKGIDAGRAVEGFARPNNIKKIEVFYQKIKIDLGQQRN